MQGVVDEAEGNKLANIDLERMDWGSATRSLRRVQWIENGKVIGSERSQAPNEIQSLKELLMETTTLKEELTCSEFPIAEAAEQYSKPFTSISIVTKSLLWILVVDFRERNSASIQSFKKVLSNLQSNRSMPRGEL